MTTLTPDSGDELAQLRRRAYGPAEAALDAGELARLHELEERVRPAALPFGSGVEPKAEMSRIIPESEHASPEEKERSTVEVLSASPPIVEANSAPPAALTPAPAPVWWRRWTTWVAASLIVGVVLGVVLSWGFARAQNVPPTLVLDAVSTDPPEPDAMGWPSSMSVDYESFEAYESWNRVSVWTVTRADGASCLFLMAGEVNAETGWYSDFRCVHDGLDPQIDLNVWPGMAAFIGGDLPADSNVRFVARGGAVDVWVQEAREVSAR